MLQSLLSQARTFLLLFFLALLIALGDTTPIFTLPKTALQVVSQPIQYGLYKSVGALGQQFKFILLARRASQEHKALEEQMAQILSENATLRQQLSEAQGYLAEQQSLDPKTYAQVGARPISLIRYLRIDKGSSSGLKEGMPVVYKGNLLGQIKGVSPDSSEVILTSDPDSKIGAFSQGSSGKARGVLLGQFGSDMLMDKILHDEPVSVGDLVYSDGEEGNIPRGLVLGQVSQIIDQPNQVFKQAKIKSLFAVGDLDIVFVITN